VGEKGTRALLNDSSLYFLTFSFYPQAAHRIIIAGVIF
jgi:hypothetical protein